MNINDMSEDAHMNSVNKGFWDDCFTQKGTLDISKINLERKLMLMVEELSEAFAELRNGKSPTKIYRAEFIDDNGCPQQHAKPEGFPIELADVVIRIGDLCCALRINLEEAIKMKMKYNSTRSHLHGRQF